MEAIVVGAGHWHAPWHVAALERRGVRIVGVWDHDAEVAAARARRWGTTAATLTDLLAAAPDLAVLSPRAVDAPELALALIDAGVPTVAEKPLGLRGSDVLRIAERARERASYFGVALVNRLSPVWPILREGQGTVRAADFRIVNGTPARYLDDGVGWVVDPALGGGGALRNLGFHAADAVLALAGDESVEVVAATLLHSDPWQVEVHGWALLRCAAGWSATIEAGYVHADRGGSDFEWRVSTSRAYLLDRDTRFTSAIAGDPEGTRTRAAPSSADRYDALIGRTLEDLELGRPALVGLDDAVRASHLIDEIYRTATILGDVPTHRTPPSSPAATPQGGNQ